MSKYTNRALQGRSLKDKLPGKGSKTLAQNNGVRVDLLLGLGLNQFAEYCGAVPARSEMLEAHMLGAHNRVMEQCFGADAVAWEETSPWKDAVIRVTAKGKTKHYPIRMPYENKVVKRPAYGDELTLTPLEYGICQFAIANSTANQWLAQSGEKLLRFSPFWFITGEESGDNYHGLLEAASLLNLSNVFRVLD